MITFGEAHAAMSLRGLLPTFFTFFASICAVVVLVAAKTGTATPTEQVAIGLRWLGAPVPEPLLAVTGWLEARADVVTVAMVAATLVALVWSGGFLAKTPLRFDVARGPATAWIGLTVLAEIHGPSKALWAVGVATGSALLVVYIVSAVRARRSGPFSSTVGPAGVAAGALAGGLVVVPLLLLLFVVHTLGGLPRRAGSQSRSDRDETAAAAEGSPS